MRVYGKISRLSSVVFVSQVSREISKGIFQLNHKAALSRVNIDISNVAYWPRQFEKAVNAVP